MLNGRHQTFMLAAAVPTVAGGNVANWDPARATRNAICFTRALV